MSVRIFNDKFTTAKDVNGNTVTVLDIVDEPKRIKQTQTHTITDELLDIEMLQKLVGDSKFKIYRDTDEDSGFFDEYDVDVYVNRMETQEEFEAKMEHHKKYNAYVLSGRR
jgi:hypothetical protein